MICLKQSIHISFLLIILSSVLLVNTGCEHETDFKKLESEVHKLINDSEIMFQDKNLEGLVNRFTADGTLKITNNPIVNGHNELRENYARTLQLENFNIDLEIIKIEISKSGDMASVLGEYSVVFDIPNGKFTDNGITLFTLKRINNEWKIAAENLSSNPVFE